MPPKPPTERSGPELWAVCGALFVGTVVLFGRAAGNGFLNYDDPIFVTENPHVRAGLTGDGLVWAFIGRADYWHPLTWLSHMLDWQLYGEAARGHHLTSVLWHAVNAVLAFWVLRRLTGSFWTSAFSAALFAWHPLRVESVAWISERKDVMSGCFFLLTLWSYAAYAGARAEKRRAWTGYLRTLGLFLAGLMCKPVLVALPVLLLVLDFWPLRRPGVRPGVLVVEKLPFFALAAAVSAVTVVMQQESAAFTLDLPFTARAANALVSTVRYLGKFFWPFDLAVAYPHPGHWPLWAVGSASILLVALSAAAWAQRARRPWMLTGWLWFLVMLLPSIGLVQVGFQAMADRYTYLPILGAQLALLWTVRDWVSGAVGRRLAAGLACAALVACALRSWDQEAIWRDSKTLFTHALEVTERNDTAHAILAYTLQESGHLDEADAQCSLALAINPRNEVALRTRAAILELKGDLDGAVANCRAVLAVNPANAEIRFSLGLILLSQNHVEEASKNLKAAAAQRPELVASDLKEAAAELGRGRPQGAFVRYAAALEADRRDPDAYVGLGVSLAQLGRDDEAEASYRHAVEIQPENAEAQRAWGDLLARGRRFSEAVVHYRRLVELRPGDAAGQAALGYALYLSGDRQAAVGPWREALRLDPKFPGLKNRLDRLQGPP